MTTKQFKTLEYGDIIKRMDSIQPYVVVSNDGRKVLIQSTKTAENPSEWDLLVKIGQVKPQEE